MRNLAKAKDRTNILDEEWKKLRVQHVQMMMPSSGHPFLKKVNASYSCIGHSFCLLLFWPILISCLFQGNACLFFFPLKV